MKILKNCDKIFFSPPKQILEKLKIKPSEKNGEKVEKKNSEETNFDKKLLKKTLILKNQFWKKNGE